MAKNKPTYEALEKKVRELEKEAGKGQKALNKLKILEKVNARLSKALFERSRHLYKIRSMLNMPELYLDTEWKVTGYSGQFLSLSKRVVEFSERRKNLRDFLQEGDFEKITRQLENINKLQELNFDRGGKWKLRYKGPSEMDKIGESWVVHSSCSQSNWEITYRDGSRCIFHRPHIQEENDCYLMSAEEFGSADEDIKIIYKVKTSTDESKIRDLSAILCGSSAKDSTFPDLVGYAVCSGSYSNSISRIQRLGADIVSRPEVLEPDANYQITIERIGGRIRKTIRNLDTGRDLPSVEMIDSNAIYDRQNHFGFTTFCGEAQFYDIEVYTRKSSLSIEQFKIPFDVEVGIREADLLQRVFRLKLGTAYGEMDKPNILLFEDITERKKAEEMFRRTRFSVDQALDSVYWLDSDGTILDVNDAACKNLGYSKEELLTMKVFDLGNEFSPGAWKEHWKLLKEKRNLIYKATQIHKDGSDLPVEINSNFVEFDDHELVCSFVRDITERIQLEEERTKATKLESIGILAGGIAHDFNNILTSVLGNISLANMFADKDSKISKLLKEAEKACLRARDLTQQLLTFSKGGAPVKKVTSLAEIIKDSTAFPLSGSNVECEFSISEDLWPAEVDVGQFSQVINNLIINADQAMPEGGIIKVCAENVQIEADDFLALHEGKYIKLTIEDRGHGIPEEYLPKIFDPYFSTKEKGHGLGLATCYSVIKRHGGHITVESEPGAGATFRIYIPASPKVVPEKEKVKEDAEVITGKILVMDDDEAVRTSLGRMLRLLGNDVVLAENGEEAVRLYRNAMRSRHPIDMVILDLTVRGGMGGKKTIGKLLEIDPEVKAIVSSGYSVDPVLANFREYGFSGMVSKPYKIDELKDAIRSILEA